MYQQEYIFLHHNDLYPKTPTQLFLRQKMYTQKKSNIKKCLKILSRQHSATINIFLVSNIIFQLLITIFVHFR